MGRLESCWAMPRQIRIPLAAHEAAYLRDWLAIRRPHETLIGGGSSWLPYAEALERLAKIANRLGVYGAGERTFSREAAALVLSRIDSATAMKQSMPTEVRNLAARFRSALAVRARGRPKKEGDALCASAKRAEERLRGPADTLGGTDRRRAMELRDRLDTEACFVEFMHCLRREGNTILTASRCRCVYC